MVKYFLAEDTARLIGNIRIIFTKECTEENKNRILHLIYSGFEKIETANEEFRPEISEMHINKIKNNFFYFSANSSLVGNNKFYIFKLIEKNIKNNLLNNNLLNNNYDDKCNVDVFVIFNYNAYCFNLGNALLNKNDYFLINEFKNQTILFSKNSENNKKLYEVYESDEQATKNIEDAMKYFFNALMNDLNNLKKLKDKGINCYIESSKYFLVSAKENLKLLLNIKNNLKFNK